MLLRVWDLLMKERRHNDQVAHVIDAAFSRYCLIVVQYVRLLLSVPLRRIRDRRPSSLHAHNISWSKLHREGIVVPDFSPEGATKVVWCFERLSCQPLGDLTWHSSSVSVRAFEPTPRDVWNSSSAICNSRAGAAFASRQNATYSNIFNSRLNLDSAPPQRAHWGGQICLIFGLRLHSRSWRGGRQR